MTKEPPDAVHAGRWMRIQQNGEQRGENILEKGMEDTQSRLQGFFHHPTVIHLEGRLEPIPRHTPS